MCNFPEKHDCEPVLKARFSRMISTGDQIENSPFREKTRCELTVFLCVYVARSILGSGGL